MGAGAVTATSFTYDGAGDRVSKTTGSEASAYVWDAEGELVPAGADEFVYDASGNRLLRTDAAGTTVYLPGGQEIRIDGVSVSASRYYSFAGRTVAVRTGSGFAAVTSLVADHHGSPVASIPNTVWTAGSVERVFSDPFGGTRGGSDVGVPGDHRFLGAVRDAGTGLTLLGARYYDDTLGRFISVDPLLDPGNPAQFNAYVYAENSPLTFSDPSGLCVSQKCRDAQRADKQAMSGSAASGGSGPSTGGTSSGGASQPPPTSWAALQQCTDHGCVQSWLFGANLQFLGGIGEGLGDLVWSTCSICQVGQGVHDNFDMFTNWDGYFARKMAEVEAQQALGFGGAWNAFWGNIGNDWANNPGHALGGTTVTVGTIAIPGGGLLKVARTAKTVENAMAGVQAAGRAGETLAGIIKNSQRIPSASGTAAYRIPDELNAGVLGEVKNVSQLSYTNQLRDFAAYSSQNGLQFNLYVRGNTQLTGPLQHAVDSGRINLIRNLP